MRILDRLSPSAIRRIDYLWWCLKEVSVSEAMINSYALIVLFCMFLGFMDLSFKPVLEGLVLCALWTAAWALIFATTPLARDVHACEYKRSDS